MSSTTPVTRTSGLTTGGRFAVVALAWLFTAAAVIQVFLAGLSVFDSAARWEDHVNFGRMIGILAYLLPIAALVGRVGIRLGVMALVVTILYILQMVLANLDNGAVAALHAVNALALIGVSWQVGNETFRLVRSRA